MTLCFVAYCKAWKAFTEYYINHFSDIFSPMTVAFDLWCWPSNFS